MAKKQKFISIYRELGFKKLKFKKSVKRKNIRAALAPYRKKGYDVRKAQKDNKDIYVIF